MIGRRISTVGFFEKNNCKMVMIAVMVGDMGNLSYWMSEP
jgi:hypothetical protein